MKVCMKYSCGLFKRIASDYDACYKLFGEGEYEVQAIKIDHDIEEYLLYIERENYISWIKSEYVKIIDNTVPSNWYELTRRNHPVIFKFQDHPEIVFSISYFHGPKQLLDNQRFMLDVIEHNQLACEFLQSILKIGVSNISK